MDDVQGNVKIFGLGNWRLAALDREKWSKFLEETKIQKCIVEPLMVLGEHYKLLIPLWELLNYKLGIKNEIFAYIIIIMPPRRIYF